MGATNQICNNTIKAAHKNNRHKAPIKNNVNKCILAIWILVIVQVDLQGDRSSCTDSHTSAMFLNHLVVSKPITAPEAAAANLQECFDNPENNKQMALNYVVNYIQSVQRYPVSVTFAQIIFVKLYLKQK